MNALNNLFMLSIIIFCVLIIFKQKSLFDGTMQGFLPFMPLLFAVLAYSSATYTCWVECGRIKIGKSINCDNLEPGQYPLIDVYYRKGDEYPSLLLIKIYDGVCYKERLIGLLPELPQDVVTWQSIEVERIQEGVLPAFNIIKRG